MSDVLVAPSNDHWTRSSRLPWQCRNWREYCRECTEWTPQTSDYPTLIAGYDPVTAVSGMNRHTYTCCYMYNWINCGPLDTIIMTVFESEFIIGDCYTRDISTPFINIANRKFSFWIALMQGDCEIQLDDDLKQLNFFSIESGDTILLRWWLTSQHYIAMPIIINHFVPHPLLI